MDGERFTNREIQLMFDKMQESLRRIEDYIKSEHIEIKKEISDLEVRVTHLETFQTRAMTIWAVAVTTIGYLLNKFL